MITVKANHKPSQRSCDQESSSHLPILNTRPEVVGDSSISMLGVLWNVFTAQMPVHIYTAPQNKAHSCDTSCMCLCQCKGVKCQVHLHFFFNHFNYLYISAFPKKSWRKMGSSWGIHFPKRGHLGGVCTVLAFLSDMFYTRK